MSKALKFSLGMVQNCVDVQPGLIIMVEGMVWYGFTMKTVVMSNLEQWQGFNKHK